MPSRTRTGDLEAGHIGGFDVDPCRRSRSQRIGHRSGGNSPDHAEPAALPQLLSLFWIGFSVTMVPASALTKRYGGVAVMAGGALIAAASACASSLATDIVVLSVAQFISGGAWGAVTMSAVAAALRFGHAGSEGKTVGAMYSVMAVAAGARIAVVAADIERLPALASTLSWLPTIAWSAAGLMLLPAARRPTDPT